MREKIKKKYHVGNRINDYCHLNFRQDSDAGINWDDVEDLAGDSKGKSKGEEDDIPTEVQDKLLSDYERELITEKMKKGGKKKGNKKVGRDMGQFWREIKSVF